MPRRRTEPPACTEPNGSVQKAVIYTRVSTEEQARFGVSLDAQRARIEAYCTLQNLQIVHAIEEDGVSASKRLESRPGGSQLANPTAENIVVLKLDRLFRSAEDALIQTRKWDRAGIALHIIDMGGSSLNTQSAMGRMFLTLTAAFAELERNLTAERTSTALRHKKENLQVYSPTPFGFDRTGDQLQADPDERKTLITMRQLRGRGMSYRAIADTMNRKQVQTKRGGKRWYASTVQQILANDIHK